ncbi:hypothetical protein NPIL_561941 [Nephila pilipes]|uniref:Uncharacterized protein n=1 Tax=Nephila pilipes TaxID=299642 RepID=A0A8X6TNW8_NEPPI|nr:hypothetical protein NPIL_561941 [Nephila pilipes]
MFSVLVGFHQFKPSAAKDPVCRGCHVQIWIEQSPLRCGLRNGDATPRDHSLVTPLCGIGGISVWWILRISKPKYKFLHLWDLILLVVAHTEGQPVPNWLWIANLAGT